MSKGRGAICPAPAPPVPSHTGLLLLQHKAGDLQHVEEGHAHDVGDGVTLAPQALLKPGVTVAVRDGVEAEISDAIVILQGRNGLWALIVFPAAEVRAVEHAQF